MKRRSWGSIERRGNSIRIRYGPRGKYPETLPKGATMKDAELLLAKRHLEWEAGTWIEPSRTTLAAFLPEWLARSGVKDGTLRAYQRDVRRILAVLGDVVMQRLTAGHVERLKRDLAQRLAPKSINVTLDTGRTAFNWAMRQGLAVRNPFAAVSRVELEDSDKIALAPEQAARLLAELRRTSETLDNALAFMLLTLRRYSEMAGLRWADVDVARRQYTVNQVWLAEQQKFKPVRINATKNKRATHELADQALGVLKQQQLTGKAQRYEVEQAGWEWRELGLVFTADLGGPVPRSSLQKALTYACKRAGVEPLSLHELRHTGASLLIFNGADQWQLMAAGGWTSLAMIQRHYGHLFAARTREALDGLGELLTRRSG